MKLKRKCIGIFYANGIEFRIDAQNGESISEKKRCSRYGRDKSVFDTLLLELSHAIGDRPSVNLTEN